MIREEMTRYQFATVCHVSKCDSCEIEETCQTKFSNLKYVMKKRNRQLKGLKNE